MQHKDKWLSLRANGQFICILNLELPKIPDRFLQAGVVVDEDVIYPRYLSFLSLQFAVVVLAIGMTASFLLTSFLLKPLVNLEQYLSLVADQANSRSQLDTVPGSLLSGSRKSRDEFKKMVLGLNALIERVNRAYRASRLWAYQMAHELKTPLAIQNLEIERLQKKYGAPEEDIAPLLVEGKKISSTIDSFLDWAEVENTSARISMFALRLGGVARSIGARLEGSHPNRIQLEIQSDPRIVASLSHVEQMISNLLTNALIYTEGPVTVRINDNSIAIADEGKGIPQEVLDRLGEPFNRGNASRGEHKGNGLGLAWVNSICRQYHWNFSVQPFESGSRVTITFPIEPEVTLNQGLS